MIAFLKAVLSELFKKPKEKEPIHKYLELLVTKAARMKGDKILFGEPGDVLPRIEQDILVPVSPEVLTEELIADGKKMGFSAKDLAFLREPADPIPSWPQLVSGSNEIPVWYRIDMKWHRQCGVPTCIFLDVLRAVDECDAIFWEAPGSKDRAVPRRGCRCVPFGDDRYVEVKLVIEENYCFSIEILAVRSRSPAPAKP